ncbi:hypothetical protein AB0C84_40465 [Actinomadura sp. NPDC048955]|uniref:hypothetical protein n=1 Tax=Actinomadura sp. NPDC048955 TaxID=3158228 RepID=UPI0033E31DBE
MDEVRAELIRAHLDREYEGEILLADGFDSAIVGVAEGWFAGNLHRQVALYDYARCTEVLIAEGMTEEDADEFMAMNVCGAYVGEGTPVFAVFFRMPSIQPLE